MFAAPGALDLSMILCCIQELVGVVTLPYLAVTSGKAFNPSFVICKLKGAQLFRPNMLSLLEIHCHSGSFQAVCVNAGA